MVLAPLIFCVVATGIAKVGDLRAVGRIGVKALIYFEVVSTAALAFGLLVGNVVRPGAGMNVNPSTLDESAVEARTQGGHLPGVVRFLLDLIPSSVMDALARNALLQVLLFAVLFGCALAQLGERVTPVVDLLERINLVFFTVLGYVMKLAPLGAFGAMAFLVGQYGLQPASAQHDLVEVADVERGPKPVFRFPAQLLDFEAPHHVRDRMAHHRASHRRASSVRYREHPRCRRWRAHRNQHGWANWHYNVSTPF